MAEEISEEEFIAKFPIKSLWRVRSKIYITINEEKRVRFFVKCYNLKLTPRKLFKIIIDKFLDDDPGLMKVINDACAKSGTHSKSYIARRTKEKGIEKEYRENFELDQEFIDELYDFFEEGEE